MAGASAPSLRRSAAFTPRKRGTAKGAADLPVASLSGEPLCGVNAAVRGQSAWMRQGSRRACSARSYAWMSPARGPDTPAAAATVSAVAARRACPACRPAAPVSAAWTSAGKGWGTGSIPGPTGGSTAPPVPDARRVRARSAAAHGSSFAAGSARGRAGGRPVRGGAAPGGGIRPVVGVAVPSRRGHGFLQLRQLRRHACSTPRGSPSTRRAARGL